MMIFKLALKNIKSSLALNIALTSLLIVTFVMTFVSSLLLVGSEQIFTNSMEKLNGPDILIMYDNSELIDSELTEYIYDFDKVENVKLTEAAEIDSKFIENYPEGIEHLSLFAMVYEKEVTNYEIITSRATTELADNEIYLPLIYDSYYEEGDIVFLKGGIELEVVGFFEDPYSGGNFQQTKHTLMNQTTYDKVEPMIISKLAYAYIYLNGDINEEVIKELITDIEDGYDGNAIYLVGSNSMFKALGLLLPILFCALLIIVSLCLFIIIILVLVHTIKTAIYSNYKQYGIMLAVGFKRKQLSHIIIIKNLIILTLSFIVASVIAYLVLPVIGNPIMYFSGLLWGNYFNFIIIFVIYLLVVIFITVISLFALRRLKGISIIRAISNKGPDFTFSGAIRINLEKYSSLPINVSLSLKKFLLNLRSYISLFILTIVLSIALVTITTVTFYVSEDGFVTDTLGLPDSDFYLILDSDADVEKVEQDIEEIDKKYEVEEFYMMQLNSFTINDSIILSRSYSDYDYVSEGVIIQGRFPNNENEVTITPATGDKLGIEVSDTVEIIINDKPEKFIVVGVAQSITNIGTSAFIQSEEINNAIYASYNIKLKNQGDIDEAISYIEDSYEGDFTVSKESIVSIGDISMMSSLFIVISIIVYIVTIIFIAIISYILSKISILKEINDIGILKSLGFTNKKIRYSYVLRLLFLTVIGTIIGVTLGNIFGTTIISNIFAAVGISQAQGEFNILMILLPILIMIIVNLFFTYMSTRIINRLEIKELVNE